jgi:hypothetical protein
MKWLLAVAVVIGSSCVDEPRPKLKARPGLTIEVVKRLEPKPMMPSPKLDTMKDPMPKPKLKPLKERIIDLSNDPQEKGMR